MAYRKYVTNDTHAGGFGGFYEHIVYFNPHIAGEVTADATHTVFIAPAAGTIVDVVDGVLENGSDASNALTMAFDVKKNGTSVASTVPAIAKTAASDARVTTQSSGTGITQFVAKTDGTATFAAGDTITIVFDITRTASPTTEITGPSARIGVKFNAV